MERVRRSLQHGVVAGEHLARRGELDPIGDLALELFRPRRDLLDLRLREPHRRLIRPDLEDPDVALQNRPGHGEAGAGRYQIDLIELQRRRGGRRRRRILSFHSGGEKRRDDAENCELPHPVPPF